MTKFSVTLDEIHQLGNLYQQRIPPEYMDENQHMNVQYYLRLAERGIGEFYRQVGMGEQYAKADCYGNYALEQHIRYFAEILLGDAVSVYMRLIDLSPKRSYVMGFLVNDTREQLAAIVEIVAMNVDMRKKRGTPFPPAALAALDALLARHQGLSWEAPVCGIMHA